VTRVERAQLDVHARRGEGVAAALRRAGRDGAVARAVAQERAEPPRRRRPHLLVQQLRLHARAGDDHPVEQVRVAQRDPRPGVAPLREAEQVAGARLEPLRRLHFPEQLESLHLHPRELLPEPFLVPVVRVPAPSVGHAEPHVRGVRRARQEEAHREREELLEEDGEEVLVHAVAVEGEHEGIARSPGAVQPPGHAARSGLSATHEGGRRGAALHPRYAAGFFVPQVEMRKGT